MEKIVRQGILYDFYGELLTGHQKEVYEMLVIENLSQSEIADRLSITRQAVHDLIKRIDGILEEYELRMGLVSRFESVRTLIDRLEAFTEADSEEYRLCEEIKELL